jgi:hypothetical protein
VYLAGASRLELDSIRRVENRVEFCTPASDVCRVPEARDAAVTLELEVAGADRKKTNLASGIESRRPAFAVAQREAYCSRFSSSSLLKSLWALEKRDAIMR